MKLKVVRHLFNDDFTIGKLYIDDKFECYTLEDEKRDVKVRHETAIPEGTYEIKLRTFGGNHAKYKEKFDFHRGMLWLQDVPNFSDILIHIGNTDDHSSGCLLVGEQADEQNGKLLYSTKAYTKMYRKVIQAFDKGEKVFITVQ